MVTDKQRSPGSLDFYASAMELNHFHLTIVAVPQAEIKPVSLFG